MQVQNCEFSSIGRYYGPYYGVDSLGGLDIQSSDNVHISDCQFTGYNGDGFISMFLDVDIVVFRGNTFEIEADGLVYNIDPFQLGFDSDFVVVDFESCGNVQVTENVFIRNDIDVSTPWITFLENGGTVCLSGNRLCGYSTCAKGSNEFEGVNLMIHFQNES